MDGFYTYARAHDGAAESLLQCAGATETTYRHYAGTEGAGHHCNATSQRLPGRGQGMEFSHDSVERIFIGGRAEAIADSLLHCRICAADCLRECEQPIFIARMGAATGVRDSHSDWRYAWGIVASTGGGKPAGSVDGRDMRVFYGSLAGAGNSRVQDMRIDGQVVWFTLGASLLAAVLSGFAPALLSSRQDVTAAIKEGGAGAGSGRGYNFLLQG